MGQPIKVRGMVLSVMPVGDYDKRLVLLTKERGKITAFAKGARRPNSALLAVCNPFVFGEFSVYEGRTAYSMVQASVVNYFMELAQDYEKACYGFYFLEFADYYTREGNNELGMVNLLYVTLKAVIAGKVELPLIRYIYELKAMVINGEYPNLFSCCSCGGEKNSGVFSLRKGGLVCMDCRSEVPDALRLSDSTLYALQYIITVSPEKLYGFTVSGEVQKEIRSVMEAWKSLYLDRSFKTLGML